ncbi:MAG TPA: flagellar biosynthesis anti-sigma factor FlgM [Thermodesulfobacteriota bacterium]|nr:flagellar biosynthesis anti-sigma factor FlgM [Thermodesulfobacteriota bacterium]
MKIGGKKPGVGSANYVKNTGDPSGAKKTGSTGKPPSPGEDVEFSSRAMELHRAKVMLDSIPDVRGEMVVRLKTDIERGDYSVDAGKVAEKMIERALRNALYAKK